jgi:pyruvate dehydrogenase E2 component (dihydrolipoamide acetyltransferase)
MAKVLEMPKLSPTMEEGQISAWHKKEGDAVGVDELLAEVETDKATMEYRSFDKGTLLKILVPGGSVVKLGQPVAIVGAPGEDVTALLAGLAAGAPSQAAAPPALASAAPTPAVASASSALAPPSAAASGPAPAPAPGGRLRASPYVRKLARERSLDLAGVRGSGPHGRIVLRDLEALPATPSGAHAQPKPTATARGGVGAVGAEPEVRPLSMMRKTIARRLTESKQSVPHFYLTVDVDADALFELRERINQDLAASAGKGEEPARVSLNDLVVKAVALALRRVPEANAQFTESAILVHKRVDVSVAVAVPEGLVTPVLRGADQKSVLELSTEIRELAARARAKKLSPDEMSNGTFSVSNLGMYGIDAFAAVINPPEGAILAVGQVRREPVVRGDAVVPGRKMAMTLSCDHRVIDGAVGATYLRALRQLLEHPTQILVQ